jgi:hypothetical protein
VTAARIARARTRKDRRPGGLFVSAAIGDAKRAAPAANR